MHLVYGLNAVGMALCLAVSMVPGLCFLIKMDCILLAGALRNRSGDDILCFELDNFDLQHLCILPLSPVICDGKNGSSNRLTLPQPQIPMIGNGPAI